MRPVSLGVVAPAPVVVVVTVALALVTIAPPIPLATVAPKTLATALLGTVAAGALSRPNEATGGFPPSGAIAIQLRGTLRDALNDALRRQFLWRQVALPNPLALAARPRLRRRGRRRRQQRQRRRRAEVGRQQRLDSRASVGALWRRQRHVDGGGSVRGWRGRNG